MILYKTIKYIILEHCLNAFLNNCSKNIFHKSPVGSYDLIQTGDYFSRLTISIPEDAVMEFFVFNNVRITRSENGFIFFLYSDGFIKYINKATPIFPIKFPGGYSAFIERCVFEE